MIPLLNGNPNNYDRFLAGFGAIVCGLVLTLAIPRFIAHCYALYPEAVDQRLKQSKQTLSIDAYEKSSVNLEKARAWFESGDKWQMQAFLHLLHLKSTQPPQEKRLRLIQQARHAIVQGLRLSPVDPYAWFRLAVVDKMLGVKPQILLDALRLSIYAGRVEPDLLMPRVSFSYRYYDEWDDEMRSLLKGQIRLLWLFRPKELVAFAAAHPGSLPRVREALFFSTDEWNRFSRNLESYTRKK